MALTTTEVIAGLGEGKSLAEVAAQAGETAATAEALWQARLREALPPASASLTGVVRGPVEIVRDRGGVAHIYAEDERDLFFGLGLAMAQDRLWQMDYLRRKATGRLA